MPQKLIETWWSQLNLQHFYVSRKTMAQLYSLSTSFLQRYTNYEHPLVLYLVTEDGAEVDGYCGDRLLNVYWSQEDQHYVVTDDWGGDATFPTHEELIAALNEAGLIIEARLKHPKKSSCQWDIERDQRRIVPDAEDY